MNEVIPTLPADPANSVQIVSAATRWMTNVLGSRRSAAANSIEKVHRGADWNDAGWIDAAVTLIIVVLNVVEVDRVGNAGSAIEISCIVGERGIVGDAPHVAFEVPEINRIETDKSGEQPDVGFGQPLAAEVAVVQDQPDASRPRHAQVADRRSPVNSLLTNPALACGLCPVIISRLPPGSF